LQMSEHVLLHKINNVEPVDHEVMVALCLQHHSSAVREGHHSERHRAS
jgi:hypothetical protein